MFLLGSSVLWAQKPKSTITFYTEQEDILQVSVNNRMFDKRSSRVTVSNIPGKRPYVEIFRLQENSKGQLQLQRIYSGTLKLEPGQQYTAEVVVNKRAVALRKGALLPPKTPDPILPVAEGNNDMGSVMEVEDANWMISPLLDELLNEMDNEIADEGKLNVVLSFKNKDWTVPNMIIIMQQLLFDESRLKFLKSQSIEQLSPKQIEQLQEALTSEEAKQTLDKLK